MITPDELKQLGFKPAYQREPELELWLKSDINIFVYFEEGKAVIELEYYEEYIYSRVLKNITTAKQLKRLIGLLGGKRRQL